MSDWKIQGHAGATLFECGGLMEMSRKLSELKVFTACTLLVPPFTPRFTTACVPTTATHKSPLHHEFSPSPSSSQHEIRNKKSAEELVVLLHGKVQDKYSWSIEKDGATAKKGKKRTVLPPRVVKRQMAAKKTKQGSSAHIPVGTAISKVFDEGRFAGTVTSYDGESSLYHVRYADGDKEDLDLEELVPLLAANTAKAKVLTACAITSALPCHIFFWPTMTPHCGSNGRKRKKVAANTLLARAKRSRRSPPQKRLLL
jgi:hypothetical protein